MNSQKTLKQAVYFEGIGLHTGKNCQVIIKPATEDQGIYFIRRDGDKLIRIPALSQYVVDTTLSTTLGKEGATISTVEHLMSAVWGLGIDNAEIEVKGPEIPILDGSSYPFVKKIKKVGLREQDGFKKVFVVTKPVSIVEGDRYCYVLSHHATQVTCSIEFAHAIIGRQKFQVQLESKNFSDKISRARTFGFLKDVESLKKKGLIAGGSMENAIVLDDEKVLNKEGLRYRDEFARHKVLDTIGDMALLGFSIQGHWVSHKAGHELHYKLLRKILTEKCGYIGSVENASALLPSSTLLRRAYSVCLSRAFSGSPLR